MSTALRSALTHPRVALAAKMALAAAIAWVVVQPLGGVANDYPYYAPFGALAAISTTVVSSARGSVQTVLAILLGAGVAMAADFLLGRDVVTIAIAVLIAALLSGWRRLGEAASWVPMSTLFVLILGNGEPGGYVLAYGGLTAIGAATGVAVNMLFPPLPLDSADRALDQLGDRLAAQLEDLADALLDGSAEFLKDSRASTFGIEELTRATRSMTQQAWEARRANWRAGRFQERADAQYEQAMVLERLSFIVEDVTDVLAVETGVAEQVPWDSGLRDRIAQCLRAMAELLRSGDRHGAGPAEVAEVDRTLEELMEEVRRTRHERNADLFGVSTLVLAMQRARMSLRLREE